MRKIQYILWDWNGTLLNDVQINLDVVNYMLSERNITSKCSKEFYLEHFGFPVLAFYKKVGFDFTKEKFEHAADDYVHWYSKCLPQAKLFEDTIETLEEIKNRKIRQSILSATQKENLAIQVSNYAAEKYFDELLGVSDSLGFGKAEIGRQWVQNNNISVQNLLIVGDTLHDFEVSQKIGCQCVLIAGGHQAKHRLQQVCPNVVDSRKDILNLLIE